MMLTRNYQPKLGPDLTHAFAQTLERNLRKPRARIIRCQMLKATAHELHEELQALWMLYASARRMSHWLRNLARALPRGDLARRAIAGELRSARRELNRIRNCEKGQTP